MNLRRLAEAVQANCSAEGRRNIYRMIVAEAGENGAIKALEGIDPALDAAVDAFQAAGPLGTVGEPYSTVRVGTFCAAVTADDDLVTVELDTPNSVTFYRWPAPFAAGLGRELTAAARRLRA